MKDGHSNVLLLGSHAGHPTTACSRSALRTAADASRYCAKQLGTSYRVKDPVGQGFATRPYRVLPKRLEKFNLEVAEEKTRVLRICRFHPSMKRRLTGVTSPSLRYEIGRPDPVKPSKVEIWETGRFREAKMLSFLKNIRIQYDRVSITPIKTSG